ncbi:MAG: hypothetical protein KAG97_13620, partial [Victivallales bacterium]|nr:hypothetical protein [Victivallales bacterium]
KDGLLFSHTGPCFSALGMTNGGVDGYVSGEGERGAMVDSRPRHEYFSCAYGTLGSMWTAAFPEYGSPAMVPHLAATGQFPHTPLGTQFENSSLAHPRTPGVNDIHLRPLWKIWGIFKNERNVSIFNDYNSEGVFKVGEADVGRYLMVSRDSRKALLIISNFKNVVVSVEIGVDWDKSGFDAREAAEILFMLPDEKSPHAPLRLSGLPKHFATDLPPYGVGAFLLTLDSEALSDELETFQKPYPTESDAVRRHREKIAAQKTARKRPPVENAHFLKVEVANLALPYEESLWWDLFDNAFQLGTFDDSGAFEIHGWLTSKGFVKDEPEKREYILPGGESAWINLRSALPAGAFSVGIRSIHFGEPFYSFVKATLSTEPNN